MGLSFLTGRLVVHSRARTLTKEEQVNRHEDNVWLSEKGKAIAQMKGGVIQVSALGLLCVSDYSVKIDPLLGLF